MSVAMEESREKEVGMSLIERLVRRAPKENGMDKYRILSNIDSKGFRAPAACSLNGLKVCTCFCKRSSATRSKRLTSDFLREKFAKTGYEPVTSGNRSFRCKPKLRMKRETCISRVEIIQEWLIWISWHVKFLDEYNIAFEKAIAFVRR